MPAEYRSTSPYDEPRGVANRNAGLKWVLQNARKGGVLYFADDDNTYDIRIFEQVFCSEFIASQTKDTIKFVSIYN